MSAKPVFEIEFNAEQNIVFARYYGIVTAAHAKAAADDIQNLSGKIRQGFTVLVDLTGLEKMDLDCSPHLARSMEFYKAQGIGRVIRVMPDRHKDIGINILSVIHYRGKVPIITCDTLEEAERALK